MSRTTANDRLAELRAMTYSDYLQTPEWRERRAVAVDWARGACQLCNSEKKPLHVHHRTYDRLGAELPADLVVLCKDCHEKFHGDGSMGPRAAIQWASKAITELAYQLNDTQRRVTDLMIWRDGHNQAAKDEK